MNIDALVAEYGYTRRVLMPKGYDTNLGLIRYAIEQDPKEYPDDFTIGDSTGDFITLIANGQTFGYLYNGTQHPEDNSAYDGDPEWKTIQAMWHDLSDTELETKIYLDSCIEGE